MFTALPYLYEGEITDINENGDESGQVLYQVRITLPNGSDMYLPFVPDKCMFGGIADYAQFRRRPSASGKDLAFDSDDDSRNATIGDRVYIAFINGNFQTPVIIGYANHRNRNYEFAEDSMTDYEVRGVIQYLGLRVLIDEKGQFTFIHGGAPEVKDTASAGPLGAALGAVAGLLGGESPSNPSLGAENDAVTPASTDGITLMEFLEEGVFRIRDSEGQMIEMDRTKPRIYISNNDLKSTEDASSGPASGGNLLASNSTDAEYILLDKDKELVLINARQIIQLYSFDRRKDVTEGNHQHKVGGNNKWIIEGDEINDISGDQENTVGGDVLYDATGAITLSSSDSIGILPTGDLTLSSSAGNVEVTDGGQAFVKLSGGTVQIGTAAGELLDTLAKVIEQVGKIATALTTMTVGTGTGPSTPPVNAADFTAAFTELQVLKTLVETMKG